MKNSFFLGVSCLVALGMSAQSTTEPLILPEFYAFKISSNGRWLYSNTGLGEIVVYDLETSQNNVFNEISCGNGNVLSLDGTLVGSTDDGTALVIKGETQTSPNTLASYWYSSINGITGDATRIVGVVGNPGSSSMSEDKQIYLPYVMDIDENGNFGEPVILPYPDKDFFGLTSQYCSATWISSDGKTILGQLIDYTGRFIQPIVYRQDSNGKWDYSLPTKSMFNPDNIEIPEFPGDFNMLPPDPTQYMSDEMKEVYYADMLLWETQGDFNQDLYPGNNLEEYMTAEEIEEYNKACDEYNIAATEYNEAVSKYLEIYYAIIEKSIGFLQNGSCMNTKGTMAAITAKYTEDDGDWGVKSYYTTYLLNLTDDSLTKIGSENSDIIPVQVLDGNMVLASSHASDITASYIYIPGNDDYIPVAEYFASTNPSAAEWMTENLVHQVIESGGATPLSNEEIMISGNGLASDNFSVFASGVQAYLYDSDLFYMTYVFSDLSTGVKKVTVTDNSPLRVLKNGMLDINGEVTDLTVIDLSGRKVFGMPEASGNLSTGLSRGVYIITYTDARGQRLSQKVRF